VNLSTSRPWLALSFQTGNRVDLDWKAGSFNLALIENKLTLERTFSIRSHHFIPYVAAEALL